MIKCKNVLNLCVPYPNIESGLVKTRHRYVVKTDKFEVHSIQTLKQTNVGKDYLKEKIIIYPQDMPKSIDHMSALDLSKCFLLSGVVISDLAKYPDDLPDIKFYQLVHYTNIPKILPITASLLVQANPKVVSIEETATGA
ncbi:hypothetical protein DIS10_07155 [Leuconostoc mesenteroides]|nr:hypothetical protein DIS10_07155 [Leuconostoc mesenteroides]